MILIAAVAALAALAASVSPAAGQDAASAQVELRYTAGADAASIFTPAKALTGGRPFQMTGPTGSLNVAGTPVPFAVTWHAGQEAFYAGMDQNGDGKVGDNEFAKLNTTLSATFSVKVGDKTHVVRVANLNILVRQTNTGGISSVSGGYAVCGYYQGSYQGNLIRLFDENLDGRITHDGADAIMVGRSGAAIPLRQVHQIGNRHCTLSAAEDGSSLTVTPVDDPQLGVVETSYRRGLKVLAMVDDQGHSYDITASGRTGVPAGRYKLVYGALTDGSAIAIIRPTANTPVYEVQAGKINTLRIGAPLWVSFAAGVSGAGNVTVLPSVNIYGAGYEEYRFDMSGGTGRPHVLMMEGQAVLQDQAMEYG